MLTDELERIKKEKEIKIMEMELFSAILASRTRKLDEALKDIAIIVPERFRYGARKN